MTFNLILNILPDLYLGFCSELEGSYRTLTYFCVLGVLIFFFCSLLKVLLIQIFYANEQTEKCHQGRAKRRRKGGTQKDCRYFQREKEDIKMLIFLIKSPLGQRHNSMLFRQLLCPDASCEVCNDATTEMDQLLSSLALEDATLSVSPLASTAPVTEPAVTPGDLITSPLPEPFPQPPSNLSTNPVASLGDFPSQSPWVHSLPPEPFPPLESEFAVDGSPPPPLAFPSLLTHDTQSVESPLTLNTIFIDVPITQDINTSPDLGPTLNPTASVTYHRPPTMSVSPAPHYSLTVSRTKSIHISSKPALENSSLDCTGALATYVHQGTDHPSLSISDFSCQEACIKDPLPSALARRDFNQVQDVGYDTEENPESSMRSPSGANSTVLEQSKHQRQSDALKVHMSKKLEEIIKGQLPMIVQSSLHVIQQTLSVQPHSETEQRSLAISVGEENCLDTCQELSFIESNAKQMLEDHIIMFNLRTVWGLPAKVLQSIELFKSGDSLSHSFLDYKFSSSTNAISEVVSKSGGFTPLRGSSETFNHPYSATSLVGQKGQGTLRQSPSEIAHQLAEEVPRIPDAGQTLLPVSNSITGKEKERDIPRANIPPPMLPIRQTRAGHEPKGQSVGSSQGKEMKKSEPVSMPNMSRAEELNTLQSKMSDTLTTSKPGISQRVNVSENKGITTVTTKSLPAKTSVLQDPKSENSQLTLIDELKWKLKKRKQSQAQGQHTHVSHASDSLTNKASLTHAQGVSSVDGAVHQVLHVHLANMGVSMEQPQEPWVPKNISRLCQDKNFPPAAKARPTSSTSEELGGGDAGLGTSQPGRKRFPTGNLPLKERLGTKSLKTPSQKAQTPSESLSRNQMNQLFQWLHPEIKCKQQEYSQEKGSPLSSIQSRGPAKSRAVFTGLFPEEKLGHRHEVHITCPQEPLPSAVKFAKAPQTAAVWARAEPVQGHPFNLRAPSFKETNTQSFCQEAAFIDKDRNPWKVVALKDQLVGQKQLQSVPIKGDYAPSKPRLQTSSCPGAYCCSCHCWEHCVQRSG